MFCGKIDYVTLRGGDFDSHQRQERAPILTISRSARGVPSAGFETGPFDLCPAITPSFAALAGLRIGPGWRKAVMQRMGGVAGCTHLTELLLGPLTTTALQTIGPARNRRQQPQAGGRPPPILDRCHALARGSDVVRRQWPEFWDGK